MSRARKPGGARGPERGPPEPPVEAAATDAETLGGLMLEGRDELAPDLADLADSEIARLPFSVRALPVLDRWIGGHDGADGAIDPDDLGRLGMFLARLLVELHDGGLTQIDVPGHPLESEWAVSGFRRGLAEDYCVPFVVSAARIGVDRSITAKAWYEQLRAEGGR